MAAKYGIILAFWLSLSFPASAGEVVPLPSTKPLNEQGDLADKMMDGLHTYIEGKITHSVKRRARHWSRDFSSPTAYDRSIQPNRDRFKKIIGVVEARVPARMERFGDDNNAALVAETSSYRIYQVRWPVLDGVTGEGLLLEPKAKIVAHVIALPDADTTPEQLVGLAPGVDREAQFARRLAENGFQVVVPVLIDRSDRWSGNPHIGFTNLPHREWIYRQAFQMGRHLIGYEVQKILAAVDWFKQRAGTGARVGVAGYGEGGLLAFYAAAVEPRIGACLVSGYFGPRTSPWEEPLYRNVWSLLHEFGDAEIATLIAPRGLVVEHSVAPSVSGPPPVRPGRRGGAAGRLTTTSYDEIEGELLRGGGLLQRGFWINHLVSGSKGTSLVGATVGPGSRNALLRLARDLDHNSEMVLSDEMPEERRKSFDAPERQKRQLQELEKHIQSLVHTSERTRATFFGPIENLKPFTVERFVEQSPRYRKYFWEEVLGKLDDPLLPMRPRTRKIYEKGKWVGYDVVLDVFPGVFAWGVLLLPKDLKPGEKRPVVVCQHGRNGLPKETIEGDHKAYHDFAARLAERGFIVFAPHNPYRGEDRYRFLSRKANLVKASLFSFILAQHEQILNWLETLPQVDTKRIAFYGLSYGGETAVRVPPLLERYCLSICSADFNEWTRKVAATDYRNGFMFTIEWEMPYFDLGNTFNYAEMASLMVPRPFMVERGHADAVAPDEWVAYEYAKVRRLYDQLGIGARTEIEFFSGPHTINGQGTFEFLHRHLQWSKR